MPKRKDLRPTAHPGIYKTLGGHVVRPRATDPRTGKPVDTMRFVKGSLREALRAQTTWRADIRERGAQKRTRLGPYVASWLARKAPELSVGTGSRYAVALEDHVLPARPAGEAPLADWYIDALTPDVLVTWRDEAAVKTYLVTVRDIDPATGKTREREVPRPYGARTVNGWLRVLKTVLADAATELRLGLSPAARLHALPEPKAYTDANPNVLTGVELGALLVALRDLSPGFFPLVATMALTGLRVSEATALVRGDIVDGVILVQRSASRGHVRERTKTKTARRVPLSPLAAEVIAAQLSGIDAAARAESLRRGEIVQPPPWVFPSNVGTPRYGTTLAKPLRRALKAAKIAHRFTPQGLRRTLNDLLSTLAPADVQKAITGHSTEAMRLHYAHVRVEARASALAAVAAVVPFPKRQP